MSTTPKERFEVHRRLSELGFYHGQASTLRRISMALHRWYELECGDSHGCIERDERTSKPYWLNSHTMKRSSISDREAGAIKRLQKLMAGFPELTYYIQTDPRGCALYILKKSDVNGHEIEQVYNRGVAVY